MSRNKNSMGNLKSTTIDNKPIHIFSSMKITEITQIFHNNGTAIVPRKSRVYIEENDALLYTSNKQLYGHCMKSLEQIFQ